MVPTSLLTEAQPYAWIILAALALALLILVVRKVWPAFRAAVGALARFVALVDVLSGLAERLGSIDAKVAAVQHQVENSHRTNLRVDIDGVREEVDRLALTVGDHIVDERERYDRLAKTVKSTQGSVRSLHQKLATKGAA